MLLELSPATSYTFPSYHASIKEPYNYFLFGQRYIRWAGAGRRAAARWAAPYMGAAASEEAAAGQRQAQPFRRRACAAPPSVFPCVLGSGLIDFKNSVLGHADTFKQINKQLVAGGWGRLGGWVSNTCV